MQVSMWMTPNPVTVKHTAPVGEAASLMATRGFRRLLVVNQHEKLAGIVTYTDVARAFPANVNPYAPDVGTAASLTNPISTIMTANPKTVAPDDPIEAAAKVMRDAKIGALPVVRGDKLEGIITESDVFGAFIDLTGARDNGVRVTLEMAEDEKVLTELIALATRFKLSVSAFLTLRKLNPRTGTIPRLGIVRLKGVVNDHIMDEVRALGKRVLTVQTQS